jgi:hypothetical protein
MPINLTLNQRVEGSIPSSPTNFPDMMAWCTDSEGHCDRYMTKISHVN